MNHPSMTPFGLIYPAGQTETTVATTTPSSGMSAFGTTLLLLIVVGGATAIGAYFGTKVAVEKASEKIANRAVSYAERGVQRGISFVRGALQRRSSRTAAARTNPRRVSRRRRRYAY